MKYELSPNVLQELNCIHAQLCKVKLGELDKVLELYKERIDWFRNKNIDQWQDYFVCHPVDEFTDAVNDERMFCLRQNGEIIAAFELASDNNFWSDQERDAYYVCKLVIRVGYKNIGDLIFKICEDIVVYNNKTYLRLNCRKSNKKLNSIYQDYGFKFIMSRDDNNYTYNLRQLELVSECVC